MIIITISHVIFTFVKICKSQSISVEESDLCTVELVADWRKVRMNPFKLWLVNEIMEQELSQVLSHVTSNM